MKTYFRPVIIASLLSLCSGIYAQSALQTYNSIQTISEQKSYLSESANKTAYINAINDKIKAAGSTAELVDFNIEDNDTTMSKSKKSAKRKASAFDAKGSISVHDTYTFTYESVDGQNNPIRLSCRLYTPHKDWVQVFRMNYGILYCHPTTTTNKDVPSGPNPLDRPVSCLVDEDAFVCCPDYCGYSLSSYRQHPYLVQDVTARNCLDAYLEAKRLVPIFCDRSSPFVSSFCTYIFGYSQGGSVSLACQKYIESGILGSKVNEINLKKTVCGDGPYSPRATLEQYVKWANSSVESERKLEYACVLPLIVMAAKDAYDKGCMRTVKVEDYFTKEFLATGIIDAIKSKAMSTTDIDKIIPSNLTLVQNCFSDKIVKVKQLESGKDTIVFNTETNEYKCLMRALDKNDLTKGWVPKHTLVFFHWTKDRVVPESNYQEVKKNLDSGYWSKDLIKSVDADDAWDNLDSIWNLFSYLYKWDTNTADHSATGEMFYRWYFDNDEEAER